MTILSASHNQRVPRACRIGPVQVLKWLLLVLAVSMALPAFADTPGSAPETPPYPRDMPLLRLTDTAGKPLATLTLDDLEALPGREVVGPIPDSGLGSSRWYGVSLRTLLARQKLPIPESLHAYALNDYDAIIPAGDLTRYDPIVAYRRDGHYLPVDAYGPLIVMYPYDSHPELYTRTYYNRTVWQLDELQLR
ncbi:molybdopterin-dependent oxidoreductase [Salinicola sp. DM10]|uniref:molybdopterin-dependent oxidoreductase n=1 Tax=Salinicola sp. DM10 TaxID=2815721 RepID=UPI001A8EE944|nr:molybdopterin-dependent oxidoreductase [Salinicola sp. DM10]MCE3026945.1 molybdopterin-dependent oxidoreductase [Salinicola sp. DM10]